MQDIADPIQGFAVIGKMRIKTDSLTDLRWDRVMPILIEEQVLMCHQMAPTVRDLHIKRGRGLSVLDLGSGSGVFGVFLDRLLNVQNGQPVAADARSSIVCLDVNPRATCFEEENAAANGSVHVQTQCERYSLDSVEPASQDVIVINPPYHPVHGHWTEDVALHGAAGEDGLAVFRDWKDAIAAHLKPGGLVIGSIMSPTTPDGGVVAMEELCTALGSNTSAVRYCRHLDDPDPSPSDFLRGVYADYLESEPGLGEWIAAMDNAIAGFTVVYFEAEKETEGHAGVREDLVRCRNHAEVTWAYRIRVHALMAKKTRRGTEDTAASQERGTED